MAVTASKPNFYEDTLEEWGIDRILLVEDPENGDVYYPLNPLVGALALDWGTTVALVRTDSRTYKGLHEYRVPTGGGPQKALYLRQHELAVLLTIIDPSRIGPRARAAGRLQEFQQDLMALADKLAFKHKQVADAQTVIGSTSAELKGEQTAHTQCPICDGSLLAEVAGGKIHLSAE